MGDMVMSKFPDPNEWHPAYAHTGSVYQWMDNQAQVVKAQTLHEPFPAIVMHSSMHVVTAVNFGMGIADGSVVTRTLMSHVVSAPAVYTGQPCLWVWVAGKDDLGRVVCSDSWLVPKNCHVRNHQRSCTCED